jgi:hypothetical protein
MSEHHNADLCDPPWEDHDLQRIVTNAFKYRKTRVGSGNAGEGFDAVKGSAQKSLLDPSAQPSFEINLAPFQWRDPSEIDPRCWLYDGYLIRKYVSGTISPGGVGKSALKLVEAVSMATGRGLLNGKSFEPLRVFYWNGEDPEEETVRRLAAICKHYRISKEDLGDRLFIGSGRSMKLVLARESRGGLQIAEPVRDGLIAELKSKRIDAFIVDPFVTSHEISENDNTKMNAAVDVFRHIADASNCAVDLIHHSRKTGGAEVTAEDSRGGSSLVNAFRQSRVLNQMSAEEAKSAHFTNPLERFRYFRMDDGKINLTPPADRGRWFRIESVFLGNDRPGLAQDNVGVVTPWEFPKPLEGLPPNAVELAQAAVAEGKWREDHQADDWVGYPIAKALGLDGDNDGHKSRVKKLLKGWTAAGFFKVVKDNDDYGHPKKYVVVGEKPQF